jgi:hypothetical protein
MNEKAHWPALPEVAALPLGMMFGLAALGMGAVWLGQKLPGPFGFMLATAPVDFACNSRLYEH